MTNREQFKELVIMGNHPECKTYEEAVKKEKLSIVTQEIKKWAEERKSKLIMKWDSHKAQSLVYDDLLEISSLRGELPVITLPITIGRVMVALENKGCKDLFWTNKGALFWNCGTELNHHQCFWELSKNGQECTDDDQTNETIDKLIKLWTK